MLSTDLVAYGIQNETSDLRVHVCPASGIVYVYSTRAGLAAIRSGNYPRKQVRVSGRLTAEGYLVPPEVIACCRATAIPSDLLRAAGFSTALSTSERGRRAVWVVRRMLARGLLPMPVEVDEVFDRKEQIAGVDLTVALRIQVKCDYNGGTGGTGNLFLQVAEINPNGEH